jgi:hypothetical protein
MAWQILNKFNFMQRFFTVKPPCAGVSRDLSFEGSALPSLDLFAIRRAGHRLVQPQRTRIGSFRAQIVFANRTPSDKRGCDGRAVDSCLCGFILQR